MPSSKRFWSSLALLFLLGALVSPRSVTASSSPAMAVDALPGGGVDSSRTVEGTDPFDVDIVITDASTPYQGYKAWLQWTDSVVHYVGPPGVTYTGLGGMTLDSAATPKDVSPANGVDDGVQFGSGMVSGTSQELGTVATARLVCAAAGVATLHLVTPPESAPFGTKMLAPGGVGIDTALSDAQITCGAGGAPTATTVPGASPTPGAPAPTPTPGTPAPTPSGPVATPTPLPPGWQTVPLVATCQFVAWTGADGTAPGELAALVGPPGNLVSLWAQQPAPVWKGYSPQAPAEANDMAPLNRLDVVAICAGGTGAFGRPII